MTVRINKEAGKGDGRRSTQDDNLYLNNFDAIFRKATENTELFKVALKDLPASVVTDKATWVLNKKPTRVSIKDAPSVLNMQDKAMWVIGYNEAIDAIEKYFRDCAQ